MERAIKKAVEEGYGKDWFSLEQYDVSDNSTILLDPLFWQSLGKAEGWGQSGETYCTLCRKYGNELKNCKCLGQVYDYKNWRFEMHRFIDHIIEGKSIDDFFNQLLK